MIDKCHVLMLNPDLDLKTIKELLKLDYTFIPNNLQEYSDNIECRNENKWYDIKEVVEINGVSYFEAKAQMEISEGTPFYHDRSIKPKDKRVNRINTTVLFVELKISENKKLTCLLIEGSNNLVSNLKSNLLGSKRELKGIKEKWNISKEQCYLNFPTEFFVWSLLKKDQPLKDGLKISDINFIDDVHELHNRKHQNYGNNVLNDILANLALFLDPKLLSVGYVISSDEGSFNFRLGSDGSIYLDDETYFISEDGEVIPIDDESIKEAYVYIYGKLLIKLLNLFYEESNELGWLSHKKDIFLREQGLNGFFKLCHYLGFYPKVLEIKNLEDDPKENSVRNSILEIMAETVKKYDITEEEVQKLVFKK